jgi:hypothetical protein
MAQLPDTATVNYGTDLSDGNEHTSDPLYCTSPILKSIHEAQALDLFHTMERSAAR